MNKATVGIVGGSGFYQMEGLRVLEEVTLETPFGVPSGPVTLAELEGVPVAFIPRHGIGHRFSPTEVNYRANIYALKSLGCHSVLSVSAVGSLREEIVPGHVVIPDQLVDLTRGRRKATFFEEGIVCHVPMGDPYCRQLREILQDACTELEITCHVDKTLVVMEGPQFSTRAESFMYRKLGFHIIGMTATPEAKLAREAELSYATLAMATDYDCWREDEEGVSVVSVVETLRNNINRATRVLRHAITRIAALTDVPERRVLDGGIITAPEALTPELRERYALFLEER